MNNEYRTSTCRDSARVRRDVQHRPCEIEKKKAFHGVKTSNEKTNSFALQSSIVNRQSKRMNPPHGRRVNIEPWSPRKPVRLPRAREADGRERCGQVEHRMGKPKKLKG